MSIDVVVVEESLHLLCDLTRCTLVSPIVHETLEHGKWPGFADLSQSPKGSQFVVRLGVQWLVHYSPKKVKVFPSRHYYDHISTGLA